MFEPFLAYLRASIDVLLNSCNTGTQTASGDLAQQFATQVGHPVKAWVGRTTYQGINRGTCSVGPSEYVLLGDYIKEFWNRNFVIHGKPHMETFYPVSSSMP